MELFETLGVAPAIRAVEPPFPEESVVPRVESLVGQEYDRVSVL